MTKKVAFTAKPKVKREASADEWVASGAKGDSIESKLPERLAEDKEEKVETTRFTIDIPVDLHARIKSRCAIKRVKMRDEIQDLLEKHFSDNA